MGSNVVNLDARTNNHADRAGSESPDEETDAQVGSEPGRWFAEAARSLLQGGDCGFALFLLTGIPARSCYRYAKGTRPIPGWLIRQLLWSEQGATWLAAIMEGCAARWWHDHGVMQRKAALYDQAQAIFAQIR